MSALRGWTMQLEVGSIEVGKDTIEATEGQKAGNADVCVRQS